VRLVGVSGIQGNGCEVPGTPRSPAPPLVGTTLVSALHEALEPVDALQGLRAIANGCVEASAQLALADVDDGRYLLKAGRRVSQQSGRVRHRLVEDASAGQRARNVHDPLHGDGRL
jgi:hypothetical protein